MMAVELANTSGEGIHMVLDPSRGTSLAVAQPWRFPAGVMLPNGGDQTFEKCSHKEATELIFNVGNAALE